MANALMTYGEVIFLPHDLTRNGESKGRQSRFIFKPLPPRKQIKKPSNRDHRVEIRCLELGGERVNESEQEQVV